MIDINGVNYKVEVYVDFEEADVKVFQEVVEAGVSRWTYLGYYWEYDKVFQSITYEYRNKLVMEIAFQREKLGEYKVIRNEALSSYPFREMNEKIMEMPKGRCYMSIRKVFHSDVYNTVWSFVERLFEGMDSKTYKDFIDSGRSIDELKQHLNIKQELFNLNMSFED